MSNLEKARNSNRISTSAWNLANPEKVRAINRNGNKVWQKANREKCNGAAARRRASKRKATPGWTELEFEKFVIQEMYSLSKLRTELTNVEHHVDHIVPLNSDIVQGLHCLANLQVIEAKINRVKSNRSWPNMPD